MRIIDSHIHLGLQAFFSEEGSGFPYDLCCSIKDAISLMDQNGIEKAFALPIPHVQCDTKQSNDYIWEAHCQYPDRMIPFCRIDDMLEQNLTKGFQGVKLHLLYEDLEIKLLKNELQLIEDACVPLIVHAQFKNKIKQVEQLIKYAPNLKIILAHMGRGHLYTGEQVIENAIGLKKYPNVFVDTSTVGDIRSIINVCEILGYERVLFGSDHPFGCNIFKDGYRYRYDIDRLEQTLLPDQRDKVFFENAINILANSASDRIRIRRAKRKDQNAIIALIDELNATDRKYLALDQKYSLIRQMIQKERHCFIAHRNGEIIGFLRESGRPEGYSMLEELIVSPRFRNMGIATMMLHYYHNAFSKNMAKTNSKNSAMIHLLTKFNYKVENPDAPRILNWIRNEN